MNSVLLSFLILFGFALLFLWIILKARKEAPKAKEGYVMSLKDYQELIKQ